MRVGEADAEASVRGEEVERRRVEVEESEGATRWGRSLGDKDEGRRMETDERKWWESGGVLAG